MKVVGGPANAGSIGGGRTTEGIYSNGDKFVRHDRWQTTSEPHELMDQTWTGTTKFT